jgi:hypothetical protein
MIRKKKVRNNAVHNLPKQQQRRAIVRGAARSMSEKRAKSVLHMAMGGRRGEEKKKMARARLEVAQVDQDVPSELAELASSSPHDNVQLRPRSSQNMSNCFL